MSKQKKFGNPDNLPITHVMRIVDYTDKQLAEKAQELADSCKEKRDIEAEKKSVMSDFKSQLDEKELLIDKLAQVLKDGGEEKEVQCFVRRDFTNKIKSYISMDDGKIMEEDIPFDEADSQVELGD